MLFLADAGGEICQLQRPTDRYHEEGKYFCFMHPIQTYYILCICMCVYLITYNNLVKYKITILYKI